MVDIGLIFMKTVSWILRAVSGWFSANVEMDKLVNALITLVIAYFVIRLIVRAVKRFFDKVDFERTIEIFIENSVGVILWVIVIVVVLANFGVDVSALVAGLGIVGIVLGFALQSTLANLAAGVFILFYMPFRVGDYIEIEGSSSGTVKDIGIAACVMETPDNVKITIPNGKIWGNAIKNYSASKTRRIFSLNVSIGYSDDLEKAIKIINKVLSEDKRIMKDPAPEVVVKELGTNSVNIAVRPTVKNEDHWKVFCDLNRNIKEAFDDAEITLHAHTHTVVHVKEAPGRGGSGRRRKRR